MKEFFLVVLFVIFWGVMSVFVGFEKTVIGLLVVILHCLLKAEVKSEGRIKNDR